MQTENNRRRKFYTKKLKEELESNPNSRKVENRYKVIAKTLFREYPNLMQSASKETIYEFLKDTVYLDRKLRLETEGEDEDVKLELGRKVVEELRTGTY